jgi:serine/threonine protein phosphatase PrpC
MRHLSNRPPISHATPSDGSWRLVRPRVRTIGASIAGPRHVRAGRANQDAWASCRLPQGVVIVVSDGVGSCRYAEIGSRAACRAVRDAVQSMRSGTPATELTERITAAWSLRLKWRNPTECAATCLFSVRTHDGRLIVGGLGDGLVVVTSADGATEPRVIPLRGGEFGETVALGDGRESRSWVVEEFDDRDGQLRTLLASDGVSQDLSQDRLQAFHDWLIATLGKLSTRRWRARLRRQLQAWPTPGATDDRTLAVMWTSGEVAP